MIMVNCSAVCFAQHITKFPHIVINKLKVSILQSYVGSTVILALSSHLEYQCVLFCLKSLVNLEFVKFNFYNLSDFYDFDILTRMLHRPRSLQD